MKHARCLAKDVRGYSNPATPGLHIPDTEPVLLLMGQDATGGDTVRTWAVLAAEYGASAEILAMARSHALLMDAWPTKKTPDLPVPPVTALSSRRLPAVVKIALVGLLALAVTSCGVLAAPCRLASAGLKVVPLVGHAMAIPTDVCAAIID